MTDVITGQLSTERIARAKHAAERQAARFPKDRGDFRSYGGIPRAQRLYLSIAAAEFVAQHLERYDLPTGVRVRWTPRTTGVELAIAETVPDFRWVLVTGRAPTFTIAGWAWGHEAPEIGEWRESAIKPAWFIPAASLRDPATLS